MDSNLSQIQTTVDNLVPQVEAALEAESAQIATDQTTISGLQGQIVTDKTTIAGLQTQLAGASGTTDSVIDDFVAGRRNVTVFSGLQVPAGWNQPGNTGNTGGGSPAPHGTFNLTALADGSTNFEVLPAGPYDNYYFSKPLTFNALDSRFAWLGTIKMTAADIAKAQCIEWEFEQCVNGFAYNGGIQLHFVNDGKRPANSVAQFDFVNQVWVSTGLLFDPTQLVTGLKVVTEYSIDYTAKVCNHKAITLNGIKTALNTPTPGFQKWAAGTNYLHYAFQMDADGKGDIFTANCSNMSFRVF